MNKRLTGVKFAEDGEIQPINGGMEVTIQGHLFTLTLDQAAQFAAGLKAFLQYHEGLDITAKSPYFLFPLSDVDDVQTLMMELEQADLMPSGLVPAVVTLRGDNMLFTALPPLTNEVVQ